MKRMMRAQPGFWAGVGALTAVLGAAPAAVACPSCATRESAGMTTVLLIAAMIGVPYVITAVTIRVFRKLGRES